MRMNRALGIIETEELGSGFMVSFEHKEGGVLESDHFPDKHAGEALIATEDEAWELARRFAAATVGRCVNIYVVNRNFAPVSGHRERIITNRGSNGE
jgi:hypothetical protein